MKIESILISNFRQFFNETKIDFSVDDKKNVTVIHGANGAGKTSLLNAFKWCFYGKTDFDSSNENILNENARYEAKPGKSVKIRLVVNFTDFDEENLPVKYTAERVQIYKAISKGEVEVIGESEFSVKYVDKDGQTKKQDSPYAAINKILPENLQPYFFFNGERIEKLASANEKGKVKEAIKYLMGLELVDRASRHLNLASDDFTKQNKAYNTQDYSELVDEKDKIDLELEFVSNNLEEAEITKEALSNELSEISEELKKHEEACSLEERRQFLNDEIAKLDRECDDCFSRQKALIDRHRGVIFSKNMFEKCRDIVEENRKKGVLPYKIKAQFVQDLLNTNECICGTSVMENSPEYNTLKQLLNESGSDDVEQSFSQLSALLHKSDEELRNFREDMKAESKKIEQFVAEKESHESEIIEINSKLVSSDQAHVARLEFEREEKQKKLDELRIKIGIDKEKRQNFLTDLNELQGKIGDAEEKQSGENLLLNRKKVAKNVSIAFDNMSEALAAKVRNELSDRVNHTFRNIIRKPIDAFIDDDYQLKLHKTFDNGDIIEAVELSTGERQVTSLSFISSIISLAKEQTAKKATFFTGGLYPLVMDSPFGALDDEYRLKVSESVASLADQVIIFVSNSQWNGKVKAAIGNSIGKSYRLVYFSHSEESIKNSSNEYIRLSDSGYEYSGVEEVSVNE